MRLNSIEQVNGRLADLLIPPPDEGFNTLAAAFLFLVERLLEAATEEEERLLQAALWRARAAGIPADQWPTLDDVGAVGVVAAYRREAMAMSISGTEARRLGL